MQNQTLVASPLQPKPVEEKPYIRKLQKVEIQETPEAKKADTSEETRGIKQKNISDSPAKNINKLLDVVKKEKKQKTDSFPSKGHVLNETRPEPMEVDTGSGENIAQSTNEDVPTTTENEDSLEEFVFVIKYENYVVWCLNFCCS